MAHIYLVGLPGSGKSTVAHTLAQLIGWHAVDLDERITAQSGTSIPDLFARGEPTFRALESAMLQEVSQQENLVVATGGGVVIDPVNRELMQATGIVIHLRVSPNVAAERVATNDAPVRPLLTDNPLQRLTKLAEDRAVFYADAHLTIDVDQLDPEAIAQHIFAHLAGQGWFDAGPIVPISVDLPQDAYTVSIGQGVMATIGQTLADLGLPLRCTVVIDSAVNDLYGEGLNEGCRQAGVFARTITVPAGEQSKSLSELSHIYDILINYRHERREAIVAIGGGVVGDLAGFAAATFLRGVPLIHVPTTLLAQVDSAIGGKTGINHRSAKNAIGAFYQPRAVLVDPLALLSLPERCYREGFGEVIKYGAGFDETLFAAIETQTDALLARERTSLVPVINRCIAIKANVVAGDEKESGDRALLNYGHTLGHAFEAIAGYGTLLHGEAVLLGMALEARIARKLELCSGEDVARQDALIRRFLLPLPDKVYTLDPRAILNATRLDKKTENGSVRWVLPVSIGKLTIMKGVADEIVLAILGEWQHDRYL